MTRSYVQVGAGGTGSILFPHLAQHLEAFYRNRDDDYTITLIDGKEVGATKLDRQLFFGRYVGDNKAEALAQQYETDPRVVIAVPKYLGEDNIGGLRNGDVVLICADNFPVRARIEQHARTLQDVTVINGGNEMHDGSLQIWIRRGGEDITPPLSQGHPEILSDDGLDPSALSCQQIAELPGGEQTLIANMMSATAMLSAVSRLHDWEAAPNAPFPPGEEVFWDLHAFAMRPTLRPPAAEEPAA